MHLKKKLLLMSIVIVLYIAVINHVISYGLEKTLDLICF